MAKRPRQQRILSYGEFRPTGVDDSAARRMQALAGLGQTVAGVAEQFGRAKAEREAPEQAQQAVEEAVTVDPETGEKIFGAVPTRRGWGSEAFNRTAVNAYLSEVSMDADAKFIELQEAFKDDPAGFASSAEAYRDATIKGLPADAQIKANEVLTNRILSTEQKINTEFLRQANNKNINTLNNSIDVGLINIANLAREGDVELANSEAEMLELTMDALAEASPKYASVVSEQKRKLKNKIYEQTELSKIDAISEEQGIPAAMSALDDLLKKPIPQGYSQEELRAFEISTQQDLNRQNSRLQATKTVATKEATAKVRDYITARTLGQPIEEQERASVYEIAKGTPLEEKLFLADEIGIFATASLQARNEMLDAARTGGLDRADAYKAMLVANADINRQAREDGISMFVAQGLGEPIAFDPLAEDFDSPENQEAFAQRQEQAKLASEHYGVSVSPLTDNEASALSNTITQMTPAEKVELVNVFGSNSALWGQIAPKQQGVFAQAAASGDRDVQETIFKGQDLLANKLVATLKANDGYMSDFNDIVGTVYGPNDKRDTLDAALNYYYGSLDVGEDQYSPSKFKAAVQAVTGGVEKIRGYDTQLVRGVTANELDLYFSTFTVLDLEKAGIKSTIITKDKIIPVGRSAFEAGARSESKTISNNLTLNAIHNGRIKAIAGQGNYHVYDDAGIPIYGEDGAPIIFNVTQQKITDAANRVEETAIEQAGSYEQYKRKKFMTPILQRDL